MNMQSKSFMAIIATVLFLVACKKEDPNSVFTTEQEVYAVKESVQFKNQSTNALSYYWNFGDGTSSTLKNPGHTYNETGEYLVTLQVEGGKKTVPSEFSKKIIIKDEGSITTGPNALFANTDWDCERIEDVYYSCFSDPSVSSYENPNQSLLFNDNNTVLMLNGSTGNLCEYEVLNDSTIGFFENPYYRVWTFLIIEDELILKMENLTGCPDNDDRLQGHSNVKRYKRV